MNTKVRFTVKYRVDEKHKIAEISCWIEADQQDLLPDLLVDEDITILNKPLGKNWGSWIEGYRNSDYSISIPLSLGWQCLEKMVDLLIQFEYTKLEEVYRRNLEIIQTKPLDIFQGDAYTYKLGIE